MLVKKAKENLNSFESDQQTSPASIQITRNKNPSTGFLSYAREITWLMFILFKLLPKSKIYNTLFFCLGPLVWIQSILLMLRFFHTIGLGAVDYEMVDSAVRKKSSKARGTYKVYSDKGRFSIAKNTSISGTTSAVRRWKKIYAHINETTICGFKKRYEAQIKDGIHQKDLRRQLSSINSEHVRVY